MNTPKWWKMKMSNDYCDDGYDASVYLKATINRSVYHLKWKWLLVRWHLQKGFIHSFSLIPQLGAMHLIYFWLQIVTFREINRIIIFHFHWQYHTFQWFTSLTPLSQKRSRQHEDMNMFFWGVNVNLVERLSPNDSTASHGCLCSAFPQPRGKYAFSLYSNEIRC